MAHGVATLKQELSAAGGLSEFPEIHQFLDGFYLSRIGIRMLIGQHIELHKPQREDHIGEAVLLFLWLSLSFALNTFNDISFKKVCNLLFALWWAQMQCWNVQHFPGCAILFAGIGH
jgi:Mitochondrial branched-chain alpha-ketoacid dehydrogenase kinase